MQGRRGATRRDLPAILLFFGVFVWTFALLVAFSDDGRLAADRPLETISGTVANVFHRYGKRGNYFNLLVETSEGERHLTQEDLLMRSLPEARLFVPGDSVTAEVRHQSLHNLDWCWALKRNGRAILTEDQTVQYLKMTVGDHKRFSRKFNLWTLAASTILIACAFLLRRHFGGWIDRRGNASSQQS